MLLFEIAMALCVAAVSSAIVVAIVGWDGYAAGGWPTAVVVFGMFFLVIWAGGVWLTPLGPEVFGAAAAWIPFIVPGFIAAMLLVATASVRRPRTAHAMDEQVQAREVVTTTITVIGWVVTMVALVALALHYLSIAMPPNWNWG